MSSAHPPSREDVRASYDRMADEYARRIAGELAHKPVDRALLDAFAERVRGAGHVVDAGCGPGHVTRYLADRGVDASGLDLSPGMIEQAESLHPGIPFRAGDMTALDARDGAWAGAVAYYSLIHLPRPAVVGALREFGRVLRPGAPLFIAFHAGDETRHMDEWWGRPVHLDFVFFSVAEMTGYLRETGFTVEQVTEREPYPGVEAPTRRAYILATRNPGPEPAAILSWSRAPPLDRFLFPSSPTHSAMPQPAFPTPQEAAMSGFSAKYCRVVATEVDGDDAYVVIDTGSDGFSYLDGGTVHRDEDGWRDGVGGNGDGWIAIDVERELGVLAVWDEAPAACSAVRVQWRDEVRQVPVQNGAYLTAWWGVPCPDDSWPRVTAMCIGGVWVP